MAVEIKTGLLTDQIKTCEQYKIAWHMEEKGQYRAFDVKKR